MDGQYRYAFVLHLYIFDCHPKIRIMHVFPVQRMVLVLQKNHYILNLMPLFDSNIDSNYDLSLCHSKCHHLYYLVVVFVANSNCNEKQKKMLINKNGRMYIIYVNYAIENIDSPDSLYLDRDLRHIRS